MDTATRHAMLKDVPIISVPVLGQGCYETKEEIIRLLGKSKYITDQHIENLRKTSEQLGLDPDRQCRETDHLTTMEGIYIKVEANGQVVDRMKYVRPSFSQSLNDSETHWIDRPIVPNGLAVSIEDLYADTLRK